MGSGCLVFVCFHWTFSRPFLLSLSCLEDTDFSLRSSAVVSVIGFWLGGAATSNFISGMILSIAEFVTPEYQIQPWHKYLVYVAVIWAAVAVNVFGSQVLPAFNKFICEDILLF